MQIAILALGMSEKNDSVTNDVAHQYRVLKDADGGCSRVRVFAPHHDPAAFPDIPVETIAAFQDWIDIDDGVTVIFHFCDSRTPYDDFLRTRCRNLIVRWHNATPPWFSFGVQNQNANHALLGYENIIEFIACKNVHFWANSEFTRDQLLALGAASDRCQIVFPASRYLTLSRPALSTTRSVPSRETALDLLFVSRVVGHKGHANAVALADRLQEISGRSVTLNIVGKGMDDPNAFTSRLARIIRAAKCKVVVHGLVSDETLIQLYQSADVFVCLSEHEGFGLPIFEAMRYRLPIVAWATTSFRELLAKHPFAFPAFDLDLFACAIDTLDSPGVRERVLEIQSGILNSYSPETIRTQIREALARFESSWGRPPSDDLLRDAIRYMPAVASSVGALYERSRQTHGNGFDEALIFDSHSNLTSLHDLRMLKTFIEQKTDLLQALTTPVKQPVVRFRPDEFSIRRGVVSTLAETGSAPPVVAIKSDHLVFGPYVRMPAGSYSASFDARIDIQQKQDVRFEIDVNCGGDPLARTDFSLSPGQHRLDNALAFSISGDNAMVELRLRAMDGFRGSILFGGATLTKTDGPTLVHRPAKRAALGWPFNMGGLRLFPGRARRRQAKQLFARANRARDDRRWVEAAQLYGMGLRLEPGSFRHIVQAGHMHKEAGQLAEAQLFYEKALSINPADADLCLQLGHFHKVNGDLNEAASYYKKAIEIHGETAGHAGNELASLKRG